MNFEFLKYFIPFTKYPYKGENVACPVCLSDRGIQVAYLDRRLKRLSTFACGNCGMLYTNPMPTDEELDAYYARLYRFDYQGVSNSPKQKHLRKRAQEAESRAEHLVSLLKPASRTLDFGCGSGEFVTSLLALGHDANGFEPGHAYGNYARSVHGDRIKVQGWQHVSYSGQFDLVSCFHVLEHLRNPMTALKKMAEWTAPDGLVYIEVPDLGNSNPNKTIGGFHFAHLIGFNHHNLLLAGSLAGLRPKVIAWPTAIIFEHGDIGDRVKQADDGRKLAESLYGNNLPIYNYFSYQLGRVFRGSQMKR